MRGPQGHHIIGINLYIYVALNRKSLILFISQDNSMSRFIRVWGRGNGSFMIGKINTAWWVQFELQKDVQSPLQPFPRWLFSCFLPSGEQRYSEN